MFEVPISDKMYVWGDKAKFVPEEAGVFVFFDENKAPIYMGESANLRQVFTDFLESEFSGDPCKRGTKYYQREVTSTREARLKELLEEHRQAHGELPKCNLSSVSIQKEAHLRGGFHFYEDIGRMLDEIAVGLDDFRAKLSKVPVNSVEFHQKRGDFANWIRDVLKNERLAETIGKIDSTGETLRRELLNSLNGPEKAACPKCGTETCPVKTWKMAGRPSKAGEKLQLTIGYYKCPACTKSFRQVLKKEKIAAA